MKSKIKLDVNLEKLFDIIFSEGVSKEEFDAAFEEYEKIIDYDPESEENP